MAPRSTASHLSYDLRPAKQSERRMLLDILKSAGDIGLPISRYRYVGMGANRFYDFLLIHRYLGLTSMVSLEHDPKMLDRAEFNCPYDFIKVIGESAATFLGYDTYTDPTITWFDYDGGLSPQIVRDIVDLGVKTKVGDFAFVTVYGGPPRALEALNAEARLAWLQDEMRAVSGLIVREDTETAEFPVAVHKVLKAAFQNAFAARRDGKFQFLIQVEYSDSVPMVTVGGGFVADGQASALKSKIDHVMPFLAKDKLYRIKSLHLTERERVVFDRAVTKRSKNSSERRLLKRLGFKESEIKAYADLLRFVPRYVETIV